MLPLIGITAGKITNHLYPHSPTVLGQSHTYIDAVARAGGSPLIMPIVKSEAPLRRLYESCQGILFSGGNDVNPALYNEEKSEYTVDFSAERDSQELKLLEWALEDDKPVLAICRGMQLLNVALGGSLYQHIPNDLPDAAMHDISGEKKLKSRIVHDLRIKKDSRLAEVLDATEIGANAYHHQAVKDIGRGLIVTAWSHDGVIEALELPGHSFVLGVQSHPESLEESIERRWRKLFASFVQASQGA